MEALWVLNDFMDGKLRPAIDAVYTSMGVLTKFVKDDAPAAWEDFEEKALAPVKDFVKDDLIPALNDLHLELQDTLQPTITATGEVIRVAFLSKLKLIKTIIDTVVLPALKALWKYFGEDIVKVVEKVKAVVEDFTDKALTKIKTVWEKDVKPALEDLRDFVKDDLIPTLSDLHVEIRDNVRARDRCYGRNYTRNTRA